MAKSTRHLDNIANKYHQTKDPYYKNLWYKLIKEWGNGTYYIERQPVSTDTSVETNDKRDRVI